MSSWEDGLQPASFRGIEFHVQGHESSHGRSLVVHEFPGRSRPAVEDFGRTARVYRMAAFLLGDDSHQRRDQLIAAVERNPIGYPFRVASRLVHPFLGELDVALRSARVRQDASEGRLVRVELEFVESGLEQPGVNRGPSVQGAKADQAAAALEEVAAPTQIEKLAGPGTPQVVQDLSLSALDQANSVLASIDVFSGPAQAIAAFQDGVQQLVAQASQLVTAPADLVSQALSTVAAIEDAVGNALGALEAYQVLLDQAPPVEAGSAGLSLAAENNAAAVLETFQLGAAGRAVAAAARADWATVNDAVEAQQSLLGSISTLQSGASDDVYQALQAVRARLVADVPPPGVALPRLESLTFGQSVSTILVAYSVDGTLDQELALARRSKAEHPGFLPAGKPIQVVVDA
ncbi:MAG: DNA circularization N-terminal domain-containing protein [Planctomycetota bacterium]